VRRRPLTRSRPSRRTPPLAHLGVSAADLEAASAAGGRMPTAAEYLPRVRAAETPSSCRTCGSYWMRMAIAWATGLRHGCRDRCGGIAMRLCEARPPARQRSPHGRRLPGPRLAGRRRRWIATR
jgi:hypothetical protein